jgi:hypothetical protein
MNVIHKYRIGPGYRDGHANEPQRVLMPRYAQLLHVGEQVGQLVLWAKVQTDEPLLERLIRVHGTGHPLGVSPGIYVGTAFAGPYVWHVFDEGWAPA